MTESVQFGLRSGAVQSVNAYTAPAAIAHSWDIMGLDQKIMERLSNPTCEAANLILKDMQTLKEYLQNLLLNLHASEKMAIASSIDINKYKTLLDCMDYKYDYCKLGHNYGWNSTQISELRLWQGEMEILWKDIRSLQKVFSKKINTTLYEMINFAKT